MKKFFLFAITVAVIAILAAGCSSNRNAVVKDAGTVVSGSPQKRFSAIADAWEGWQAVAVPVKVELKKPVSFSFSGKAYFTKDKTIFISLRKLGFEVAQLYLSADTVLLVDKFNSRYLLEEITTISRGQPIGVRHIQDIFMGQPFLAGETLKPGSFNFFEQGTEWFAVSRNEDSPFAAGFSFSVNDNVMVSLATNYFTVTYSGCSRYGSLILPEKENILASKDKVNIDVTISYSWKDAEWDSPDRMRTPKMPSSGYRRLDASSLIKGLGGR